MSLISILKRNSKKTFFTTPSHNQKLCLYHKFYQWYRADISEVDEYNPGEALYKAEQKATKIYNTKSTHFLTNGSSSGVIASVLASCSKNDNVLIWNKSHPCHKNACILAGVNIVEYEQDYDEEWGVYKPISAKQVENLIEQKTAKAIVITSPTYEGFVADIELISNICKRNEVVLIVDEAHGALYPFSENLPMSAIRYADFTIQSLHKTAGGINPTALLHCNCDLDVKSALNMISTTSPSYPMLATIEANINYLNSTKGKKYIEELLFKLKKLKSSYSDIICPNNDVTKFLLKINGLSGHELSEILFDKFDIEDERTNEKSTLLICGVGTSDKKIQKLKKILKKIQKMIKCKKLTL